MIGGALVDRGQRLTLGEIRPDDEMVIRDLARLLDDPDRGCAGAAAAALANYGPAAHSAGPALLQRYHAALVQCDYDQIENVARTLCRILRDPQAAVREYFEPFGSDLAIFAQESIAAAADEIAETHLSADASVPPVVNP